MDEYSIYLVLVKHFFLNKRAWLFLKQKVFSFLKKTFAFV